MFSTRVFLAPSLARIAVSSKVYSDDTKQAIATCTRTSGTLEKKGKSKAPALLAMQALKSY
jgi:hypothetical protein